MRDHFYPVGREFKRGGNRVALVMVTLYSCLLKGLGIMVITLPTSPVKWWRGARGGEGSWAISMVKCITWK